MIDYSNFQKALKNLEVRNEYRKKRKKTLDKQLTESVVESVIQRFEICYDCLWKILKRHMEQNLGISKIPSAPKPLCRMAFENEILSSSVEQWFKYIKVRIGTTHDYDGQKAQDAIDLVDDFIFDAIHLYQTMTGKKWE